MIGLRHVTNFKSCYNNLKLLNLSKRLCTVVNTLPYDAYTLKMPTMMDSARGSVDKWLVKIGDDVDVHQEVCQVTLNDVTIVIESPIEGVMAHLGAKEGEELNTDDVLAIIAEDENEYQKYLIEYNLLDVKSDNNDTVVNDNNNEEIIKKSNSNNNQVNKEDKTVTETDNDMSTNQVVVDNDSERRKEMLRALKYLMNEGILSDDDIITSDLRKLATKGDAMIFATFEASCEGDGYKFDENHFDVDFFLGGVRDIVMEQINERENEEEMKKEH